MRWLLLLLLIARAALAADPAEAEAFAAAAKASQDAFYERAEKGWADFLSRYPNSEKFAEAALALAQARHQLKQYGSALEALNSGMPKAGHLADQFQFWRAQTMLDMTNYAAADQAFAGLIQTNTTSPLRLNAAVGQGMARFRQENFGGVVELLAPTNSVFQQLARESTNTAVVARGFLTLAESQLRRNEIAGARSALQSLIGRALPAEIDWERWQLLARIELAGPAPDQAVPAITNAVAQARAAKRPALLAQSLNLEADIFKKLNQPARAAQSYQALVNAEGAPPELKRLALLKEVELAASQNAFTNAAGRISAFLAQNASDPAADQLNLKAGELFLEAYRAQTNRLIAPATNYIAQARAFFDGTIQQFTNSAQLGRAWLDRGWSLWEEHVATGNPQRLIESQAAFQTAAEKLPAGDERAQARLKLGEVQFKQGAYGGAATNFAAVIETPNLRADVVAHAAEFLIRAYLAQTNLTAADAALQKFLALAPSSPEAQQSWLNMAQTCAELGQMDKARTLLQKFSTTFTNSLLRADAELLLARTYALEEKWPQAIELYTKWTENNPADRALPKAEFELAMFHARAGQETNAFQRLTNFVARFPTNELAAFAQIWIGNYYFNPPRELWSLAEQNYQRVFLSTNWSAPELGCQARLAAARAAFLRQDYAASRGYLTNLLNSACSADTIAESYMILGDVFMEERAPNARTNSLENFEQALASFERVTRTTNRFEPEAWGKMGDCYFQLAVAYPESYERATNAYEKALNSPRRDVPVRVRNQAEHGIAQCLEKMAGLNAKNRQALLKDALDHYLNIVYGAPARPSDPKWQKMAALNACRLAEQLQPEAARELYDRLINEVPAMKATWQARRAALPN